MASKRTNMRRYAAALVAGTALVAPSAAWAASLSNVENSAQLGFQAPVARSDENLQVGKTIYRFDVDGSGISGTPDDTFELQAVTIENGTANNLVTGDTGNIDGTTTFTVDLTGEADFDNVVFLLVPQSGADDTYDGADADDIVLGLTPTDGRTALGADSVSIINHGEGSVALSANAVADIAEANSGDLAFAFDNYQGPVAGDAFVADANAADNPQALIQFDTFVFVNDDASPLSATSPIAPATGASLTTAITGLNTADTDAAQGDGSGDAASTSVGLLDVTGASNNGPGSPTGQTSLFVSDLHDGTDTNFDAALSAFSYDSAGGFIFDEAGNPAVDRKTLNVIPVSEFPSPDFADQGTAKVLLSDAPGNDPDAIEAIESDDGLTVDASDTLEFTLRLNAAIDDDANGVIDKDDVSVSGASGFTVAANSGATSDDDRIRVTLTADGDGNTLSLGSGGNLQLNGSDLTIALADAGAGSRLETLLGGTLESDTTAENAFIGLDPSGGITTLTLDDDTNGTLDGAQIEAVCNIASGASNQGIALRDDDFVDDSDDSDVNVPTVSIDGDDGSLLRLAGDESTIEGFLNSGETVEDNLGTGVIGTNLPFTVSVNAPDAGTDPNNVACAAVFGDDGNARSLPALTGAPADDGAAPVVTRVAWEDDSSAGDPAKGPVTITASENVRAATPGEPGYDIIDGNAPLASSFLFGGVDAHSTNINAGFDAKVGVTGLPDTTFELSNLPDVLGTELSLNNPTGVVGDADGRALVLTDDQTTNTVQEPAAAAPELVSAEPIKVNNRFTSVIARFDQDIEAPDDADLQGVFVVRLQLDRGGNSEFHDFVIPADDVAVGTDGQGGANSVTLTMPDGGFPRGTNAIFVDYQGAQGATQDDIAGTNFLFGSGSDIPAATEGGSLFGDGTGTPPASNVKESDTPGGNIATDADTVKADLPPLFVEQQTAGNTTELFTRTVRGDVIAGDGTAAPDGTTVRVDLVRAADQNADDPGQIAKDSFVGNGHVDIARGPNSSDPAEAGDQTIALRNEAVRARELDRIVNRYDRFAREFRNYRRAVNENQSDRAQSRALDNLKSALSNLGAVDFTASDIIGEAKSGNAVPLLGDFTFERSAFVVVTTGSGADTDGTGSDNPNASAGRTATLVNEPPRNAQENGTTIYPVTVDLTNGDIGTDSVDNAIDEGKLDLQLGQPATSPDEDIRFEVVDTAYALAEDGEYQAIVGAPKQPESPNDTTFQAQYDDAFILVSVATPTTDRDEDDKAEYLLTNSGDPAFESYIPFMPDLQADGTPAQHDANLATLHTQEVIANGWQLLGVAGAPAVDLEEGQEVRDIDPARFFLTVDQDNGQPISLWAHDGTAAVNGTPAGDGLNDQAFTLVENGMTSAFQIGTSANPVRVNNLQIGRTGFGLAFNNGGSGVTFPSGNLPNDVLHSIPTTGSNPAPVTLGTGWSLVSVQSEQSLEDFVGGNAGITAAIKVDGNAGADAWFDEASSFPDWTLNPGQALFVYAESEISNFNFD